MSQVRQFGTTVSGTPGINLFSGRRTILRFALAAGLIAVASATTSADELTSKVDEYMDARVKHDRFSGTILIARDGKPLVRQGYGMANLEHDVPNRPDTKFRIGSITKQFTAMAIVILQERGKLDVREKIKTYLPDSPKSWDEVTVHHLLTHSAGIPNYTSFPDFLASMRTHLSLDQLIAKFKDKPLEFKPGEKFKYSNSGYIVLGKLIEKVSGRGYAQFMRENIFDPLSMKDTGFDNPIPVIKNRASGYSHPFVATVNAQYIDMGVVHAAGALYSTVDDLLLWDQALYTEKLVKKATMEKIFVPFKDNYAYGWLVVPSFGRKMATHTGGINGFVTDIRRFPDERLCVIVLSNVDGTPCPAMGRDLAAIVLGQKYTIPGTRKEIKVDPKVYDTLAGVYECSEPKITITITRADDRLLAQIPGQPKIPIYPTSELAYFYKVVDAQLEFVKDGSGKVTHLDFHQGSLDFKAKRRDDTKPADASAKKP